MLGINLVGPRYKFLIPAIVSSLVSSNQKDGHSPRVKGKKRAIGSARMLCSQFLHIRITRTYDRIRMGPAKRRTAFTKNDDAGRHIFLLIFVQRIPPLGKFVGEFNRPRHL